MIIKIMEYGKGVLWKEDCQCIRSESGVFYLYKEHGHIQDWYAAFTLQPGQIVYKEEGIA